MTFSILIRDLQLAQTAAFNEVISDVAIAHERSQIGQVLLDLGKCADAVSNRYEAELYELAIKEIQLALLAALGASYRQAFMGLRLALEHWFAGIQYSINELSFRQWQAGERDTSWAELNDVNHGILSDEFTSIFWPGSEVRAPHYREISKKLYRECSEYVHGNPKTHVALPKQLLYDSKSFLLWQQKLETVKLLFTYVFIVRFGTSMTVESRDSLSQVVLDSLGHLKEARELFAGV